MDEDELADLWRSFKAHQQNDCRNRLFLCYSGWVRKIASTQFSKYGGQLVDWSDCVQNASIALIEAIERFDPERGVPFEAYAYSRIKGSIIDGITHFHRYKANELHQEFLVDIHLSERPDEMFDSFVDSVIELAFSKMLDMASSRYMDVNRNPLDLYMVLVEEEKISECVSRLPVDLHYVINAHYNHYLSFTQIAKEMNLSKARVSQMHKLALKKIRDIYEKNQEAI